MKVIFSVLAVVGLIGVSACAATSSGSATASDADSKQVCHMVDEIGSNLRKRVCVTKPEPVTSGASTNEEARASIGQSTIGDSNSAMPQ
jgi:hypothetical protein